MCGKCKIALRAIAMANDNAATHHFEWCRVCGSSSSQDKKWYALSSSLCGCKVRILVNFITSFPARSFEREREACGGKMANASPWNGFS